MHLLLNEHRAYLFELTCTVFQIDNPHLRKCQSHIQSVAKEFSVYYFTKETKYEVA